MTKSFEDLETMTIDQLNAIATDLGITPKAKIKKAELVQLVYDAQQPEPSEDDDNDEVQEELSLEEQSKPIDTAEQIEARKLAVAEALGGTAIEEAKTTDDGVVIFAVIDELTDEEVARGTLLELEDQAQGAPIGEDAPNLDAPEDANEPEPPMGEERVLETPELADDGNFALIEEGLKPLASVGLKYTVDGSVIKLRSGSKVVTTTLNQPAHRVVRTAEQLCNFR